MRKVPLIDLAYRHTIGAGIAVNLTAYFGASFRVMRGSDDKRYLCIIAWYPRSRRALAYKQASCRI